MSTDVSKILATFLGTDEQTLRRLDADMVSRGFPANIHERLVLENDVRVRRTLATLGCDAVSASGVRKLLRDRIAEDEEKLTELLDTMAGGDIFDRAATLARTIAKVGNGYFLKRDRAVRILTERPPLELLKHLHVRSIAEALSEHDVTEVMSALRFVESQEWMHETFDAVYRTFTAADFEERPIEVHVLGPVWREVAATFVAKKHHNVSHLKEFGVIFLNPIAEDVPGAFLRDFTLLLHYFHEIEFYAKLFRRAAAMPNFPDQLTALLRGDVPTATSVAPGEWLIVQRYLVKEDANDPRLLLPRVNPESLHWLRGQRDLARFVFPSGEAGFSMWEGLDWVASPGPVSFDLEDTAMSLVSFTEGKDESFGYHQREAMWTRLFQEYVGGPSTSSGQGEERMEKLLIENFEKGVVQC